MSHSSDRLKKILDEMLGDEYTKMALQELGLQNSAPEVQAELLGHLGSNILQRIALEILSVLPQSEHERFEQFIGASDVEGMRAFLAPFIPDLDDFIARYAQIEYESTKTMIATLRQDS